MYTRRDILRPKGVEKMGFERCMDGQKNPLANRRIHSRELRLQGGTQFHGFPINQYFVEEANSLHRPMEYLFFDRCLTWL